MNIYQQEVLERYRHPHNHGSIENGLRGTAANLSCGDELEINLSIENEKIEKAKFLGSGCAISIASADIACDKIMGLTTEELGKINDQQVLEWLGISLTPSREKCATLVVDAIHKALSA